MSPNIVFFIRKKNIRCPDSGKFTLVYNYEVVF